MTTPPTLPPEVEKEFDERYNHYNPENDLGDSAPPPVWCGSDYADIKSFISRVIKVEVGKARREQIEKDAEIVRHNSGKFYDIGVQCHIASKIRSQLTPDTESSNSSL